MPDESAIIGRYKIINFPTTATMIGLGVFSLAAAIVLMLFTKEIPAGNKDPLSIVIGAVLGSLGTVVAFYFGDSKKSTMQQDTINTLAQKPVDAVIAAVAAEKQVKAADKQTEAAETQLAAAEKTIKD